MRDYEEKFKEVAANSNFNKLSFDAQEFLKDKFFKYKFSFQEFKQLVDISIDFNMWDEKEIDRAWIDFEQKKDVFNAIKKIWQELKTKPKKYNSFNSAREKTDRKFSFEIKEKENLGLGMCPVASNKTRCCNLLTLDAVEGCGFDCSYCSIQSFYNENKIGFNSGFAKKIKNLELEPNKTYHIGTGQSSDSLLWGNKEGVLDALFEFADKNKNVILEFKTKSSNIEYFLKNKVPKNIICTWSLNTQTIIENEEHLSASLDERLSSAKKLAEKGILIGFHFHPIVEYDGYLSEYGEIYEKIQKEFNSNQITMISFGTLTFIKPVIKKLRERNFKSKILQMPLVDVNKKFSYPIETKIEMFKYSYQSFKEWHGKIFFYLCMEEQSLWKSVFGYEYATNEEFEEAMIKSYMAKIS